MARGFVHGVARSGGAGHALGRDMARSPAARRALGGVITVVVLIMWAIIATAISRHVVLTTSGVQVEAESIGYEYTPNVRRAAGGSWHPVYRFTTASGEVAQVVDTARVANRGDVGPTTWNPDARMWQVREADRVHLLVVYDPASPENMQPLAQLEAGVGFMPWWLGLSSLVLAAAAAALFGGAQRPTSGAQPPQPQG